MLINLESEVTIKKTIFKEPILIKPDELLRIEINRQDLSTIKTEVIKMGEKTPDTQITIIAQTQSLVNKQLQSNGSKVLLLQDGFILANDFLNQIEQLLTDVLGYYSEEGQWPVVIIMDPEEAKKYEENNTDEKGKD